MGVESRRHIKIPTFFFNNFPNSNFHYHIWIQHGKYIQMSTNRHSPCRMVLEKATWILRKPFKLLSFSKLKLTTAWKVHVIRVFYLVILKRLVVLLNSTYIRTNNTKKYKVHAWFYQPQNKRGSFVREAYWLEVNLLLLSKVTWIWQIKLYFMSIIVY